MPTTENDARLQPQLLLTFMSEYARHYLSSGGPTSRLEEALTSLGEKFGNLSEIFATPTGVFVSCIDQNGMPYTTLARIKESSMNLGKLCWLEGIFEDVFARKITLSQAIRILARKHVHRAPYSMRMNIIAAFLVGFALSYPAFGMFTAALACGFTSMATWWIAGPGLKKQVSSPIFRDFFGCIVTLSFASLFQLVIAAPFEAFSVGGLVILVPGLALTTAIAELADQNLVSGTAKLMQAILTLLALALAYMLFQELSDATGHMLAPSSGTRPLPFYTAAIGVLMSVSCIGILFKIPRRSLPWAALIGLFGWAVLRFFHETPYFVWGSFSASLCVGIVSLWAGSKFKVPSQVFSVPGILATLPGMLALTTFRSLALGQGESGGAMGVRVILTTGGIVFGLFMARLPFTIRAPRFAKKLRTSLTTGE